ncbi:broad-spectrum mercury transporter MerE [Pseudomonas aeruginosa]|uniref:broad-spectrum mercury transporter MerE n=1 Tax=Pseudomonas aeruginosa TaxID=287 RepID=UPI003A4DBABD
MDDDQAPGWRAYAWGVMAALTCPCHLPLLAAVLAGTSAGAALAEHWGIAALALAVLFLLALTRALRAFRSRS